MHHLGETVPQLGPFMKPRYRIALYFRGPKLPRFENAKQFHEIIFTTTSELALHMDDAGISLDKRPT